MKSDDILTPLDKLKETALDLVLANAPNLDNLASVQLTKAIISRLMEAEAGAAKRAISATVEATK
jgi:hypothetical protein